MCLADSVSMQSSPNQAGAWPGLFSEVQSPLALPPALQFCKYPAFHP